MPIKILAGAHRLHIHIHHQAMPNLFTTHSSWRRLTSRSSTTATRPPIWPSSRPGSRPRGVRPLQLPIDQILSHCPASFLVVHHRERLEPVQHAHVRSPSRRPTRRPGLARVLGLHPPRVPWRTSAPLLRLLRVDAGVSSRPRAEDRRLERAGLSRVENGHDQAPTPDRLIAIARALDLPPTLLIDLAQRVSLFVARYLEDVLRPASFPRDRLPQAQRRPAGSRPRVPRRRILGLGRLRGPRGPAPARAAHAGARDPQAVVQLPRRRHRHRRDAPGRRRARPQRRHRSPPRSARREARVPDRRRRSGVAVPHAIERRRSSQIAALVTLARPLQVVLTLDDVPLQVLLA